MCLLGGCSSLPPIPKGLMTLPVNSPPAKGGWTWVSRQTAGASVSARPHPSLPKGVGCAQLQHSSHPCTRARIISSLFFPPFSLKGHMLKQGHHLFYSVMSCGWKSSLTGVGKQTTKSKHPISMTSTFHANADGRQASSRVPKTLGVANIIYIHPSLQLQFTTVKYKENTYATCSYRNIRN